MYEFVILDSPELLRRVFYFETKNGTVETTDENLIKKFVSIFKSVIEVPELCGSNHFLFLWDVPPYYIQKTYPSYKVMRPIPTIEKLRRLEKSYENSVSEEAKNIALKMLNREKVWQHNETQFNSARGKIQYKLTGNLGFDYHNLFFSGYEADDLAKALSKMHYKKCLVTSDSDWISCVNGNTHLYNYGRKNHDDLDLLAKLTDIPYHDFSILITEDSRRLVLELSRKYDISLDIVGAVMDVSEYGHNDLVIVKDVEEVFKTRDFRAVLDYIAIKKRFEKKIGGILHEAIDNILSK